MGIVDVNYFSQTFTRLPWSHAKRWGNVDVISDFTDRVPQLNDQNHQRRNFCGCRTVPKLQYSG
jgi:hypothetical protein